MAGVSDNLFIRERPEREGPDPARAQQACISPKLFCLVDIVPFLLGFGANTSRSILISVSIGLVSCLDLGEMEITIVPASIV